MSTEKRGRGRPRKNPEQTEQEIKQSSERKGRIAKLQADKKALELHIKSSVLEIEELENEEAVLRDQKEDFTVSYGQYLAQCKENAEEESITNEQAIAAIKAQSKMSMLDRVMGAKAGFGTRRPSFPVKGDN